MGDMCNILQMSLSLTFTSQTSPNITRQQQWCTRSRSSLTTSVSFNYRHNILNHNKYKYKYKYKPRTNMGAIFSSQATNPEAVKMALTKSKEIVSANPVVVFSKSYCPYCVRVKELLSQLNAAYKAIELDQENDGDDIQAALADWTGQRTVPNVFIGGKHIGGCDATVQKHQQGELVPLLTAAGATKNNSAEL